MTDTISLVAQPRDKSVTARALRRSQIVPAVMYGRAVEATSLQFDYMSLLHTLRQAGTSRLVSVTVEGTEETQDVFFRQVQLDPVTANVIHVDLYAVVAGEKISNFVPVLQEGEAPVVEEGGIIMQTVDRLEVECLPRDMPAAITVDIGVLRAFGDRITVADLDILESVSVLADSETEIVTVLAPRGDFEELLAEAEAAAILEGVGLEGEEVPEGVEGEEAEGEAEEPSEDEDEG